MWLRTWKGLDQGAHPPKGSFKLVLDIYKGNLPPLKAFHSIIIIRHPTKKSNSRSKAIPRSSPNTPITMVNPLYVVYVLSAMTGVQACKRTCSATGDSGGTCTYNCTHVCSSISANEARNTFLAALQNGGNSCSAVGTSGVKCRKTASFGSCYNHYWSCGSGC